MRSIVHRVAVASLAVVVAGLVLMPSTARAQRGARYLDRRAAAGIGAQGTDGRTSPAEASDYSYTERRAYRYASPPADPSYTARRAYRYMSPTDSESAAASSGIGAQGTSGRTRPPAPPRPTYSNPAPSGYYYPGAGYYYPARRGGFFSLFLGRSRNW